MKAVLRERDAFKKAVARAFSLNSKLSGAKVEERPGYQRGLRAPDQRDIAQFIFLDVASQWEAFCVSVFALELKKLYHVHDEVAERMMGSIDGVRIEGYADPDRIAERARVMLGVSSPWANLEQQLGRPAVNYLKYGQTIRNFIAHAGIGRGRTKFHNLLSTLNIPQHSRQGLSAGRLLLDYTDSTRTPWFKALLDNYTAVADFVASNIH